MKLSVILPIYNEAEMVEETIAALRQSLSSFCQEMEIIAVNDGSTDGTLNILKKIQPRHSGLKIVSHRVNRGYGAALRSGIKKARYEWIFFTDADRQFDFRELKKFIKYCPSHDYIVGYRKNRSDSLRRKIISKAYNQIVQAMFNLPLGDVDCAFKLMKKKSLKKITLTSDSFFVSPELMVKSLARKYKIKELGVSHLPRKKGLSKVTSKRIFLSIIDLFKLFGTVNFLKNK